mgnify:CR=1 FL=1
MAHFFDRRSPARVIAGRANQAAGSGFEIWLNFQHQEAIHRGLLACVEKSEPHLRIVGGKKIYNRPGVADYFGTLASGTRSTGHFTGRVYSSALDGVSLAAEAKSTSSDRLARAEVKPKQAAHLDAVARAGGLALLLCEFRAGTPTRCAVSWTEVPWTKLRTADSVGLSDLTEWIIAPGENYLTKFLTAEARR